jgi:hypothetical protein
MIANWGLLYTTVTVDTGANKRDRYATLLPFSVSNQAGNLESLVFSGGKCEDALTTSRAVEPLICS